MNKVESDFIEFYTAYPRKIARIDALKAFRKVYNELPDINDLIEILELHKKQDGWNGEKRYIPHPATWLNGHRWEDEITVAETHQTVLQRIIDGL